MDYYLMDKSHAHHNMAKITNIISMLSSILACYIVISPICTYISDTVAEHDDTKVQKSLNSNVFEMMLCHLAPTNQYAQYIIHWAVQSTVLFWTLKQSD